MKYLQNMIDRLSEEDKEFLKGIYEPKVVVIPPADASRGLCVSPDGEIRIYGYTNKCEPWDDGETVYISSHDCGLSWKMHRPGSNKTLGAAAYNPESGRYLTVYPDEYRTGINQAFKENGTWAIFNDEGFDSENNSYVKISDINAHCQNPVYIKRYHRWFVPAQWRVTEEEWGVVIFTSDDDGESWTTHFVESAPIFEMKPPHKSTRWQEYSNEPTVCCFEDGTMFMLVRTSQDYHYMHKSFDGGLTWTKPEPSPFHGTITMPKLCTLSDGRSIAFWCNSQPLPERDHSKLMPPIAPHEMRGAGEDVFTNRDANHLAITEDSGKSWIGFRELGLNEIRNNADFRSIGGMETRDKSVHQAEILELPFNKLLVSYGQNPKARKVVILDINWLYETQRLEDFRRGLENVSTHMYIESNLGYYRGFSGHCAYNRTNGALLVRDLDHEHEEALQLCRVEDERLVYKKQGVVWNFPASHTGTVEVLFKIIKSGISVSLTDRWYNPCDEYIKDEAFVNVCFDIGNCETNVWHNLKIDFNTDEEYSKVYIDEKLFAEIKSPFCMPNGLSYLHIQTLAENEDFDGTLIKTLKKY